MFESLIQGGPLLTQMYGQQQEQELRRQQAPFQLEHLKALSRLDTAQAAAAEDRLAISQRMQALVKGWKPNAADPFKGAMDLVGLAAQGGSIGDMEKGIQLANVASQRQTTEAYRKVQEAEIASRTAERNGAVLQEIYGQLRAGPDGRVPAAAIDMADNIARNTPGIPPDQAQVYSQAVRQGGLPAIQRLYEASKAGAREAAQKIAAEKARTAADVAIANIQLKVAETNLAAVRAERERERTSHDVKAGGAEANIPTEKEGIAVEQQLKLIDPNFSPEGLKAAAAAVASHAKREMKKPGSSLTFEQAVVKAYRDLKAQGIIKTQTPERSLTSPSTWVNPKPQTSYDPAASGPATGTVMDGYRFKGGDPGKKENWEKAE